MSYYHGNEPGETPGILPGPPDDGKGPYYWWQGGALWGTMVDYWHYTGDTTYNDDTQKSLVWQAGADSEPRNCYEPRNFTASLGNDDQGFWAMSAMLAAENKFQNPPAEDPQWLALAQAVFNRQAARWDTEQCNGGLRWQVHFLAPNGGYNYKNTIATGIFFNMGARLARYTGNETYAMWATKAWKWTQDVGYIDENYNIWDGARIEENCTDFNKAQFSYTPAIYIQGAGFMYDYTNGSEYWATRVTNLTRRTLEYFFPNGTAIEPTCERGTTNACNTNELSMKGYLLRFLAQTTKMAPIVHDQIMSVIRTSAQGAIRNCNDDGTCGFTWTGDGYDGSTGAGQQMSALAALMTLLNDDGNVGVPVTNSTGGTSVGDPNAGGDPDLLMPFAPLSSRDRAGAGVLTAVIVIVLVSSLIWIGSRLGEGS